jgi:hypothetical protein
VLQFANATAFGEAAGVSLRERRGSQTGLEIQAERVVASPSRSFRVFLIFLK